MIAEDEDEGDEDGPATADVEAIVEALEAEAAIISVERETDRWDRTQKR